MNKFATLILLLVFFQSQSQQIENLVFEGGGIRGIAYCGAILELEESGNMESVQRVAGTSAGAITAAFLSVGYTAEEIQTIIYHTDFGEFNDGERFFVGGTQRLIDSYGWYQGEAFTGWLESHISRKTGSSHMTFADLHKGKDDQGYRDLFVCATNLTKQQPIVFSYETFPQMRIADAVRISMSVPFWFQAMGIDESGNLIEPDDWTIDTQIVIDGGLISNFPIKIFDHPKYASTISVTAFGEDYRNARTIGFRLDTEEQINQDLEGGGLVPQQIANLEDFTVALYVMIIGNLNRQQLDEKDWNRTISINTCNIGPKVKSLSEDEKDSLIEAGQKGMLSFLQRNPTKRGTN